jgi:thiosulfate dehydrogenase
MKSPRILFLLSSFLLLIATFCSTSKPEEKRAASDHVRDSILKATALWEAPDTSTIPFDEFGSLVRYGRELIINTAYYIGPEGKVSKNLGNKMNCTNCHLEAGTKPYAFNYLSSHARYPQYRRREDRILTLADRVNNCIERPHNGKPLKLDCKEMTAMVCYMKWLGQNVPVNKHVNGDSPLKIELPDRAADPVKGETIYIRECKTCHGADGEGKMRMDGICYEYPPLWGLTSYQPGSSLHRVVKAAAFIYANMPNKNSSYLNPKLTVEEAFDVAAFVNDDRIHKRPVNKGYVNYPNNNTKPLDYGTGPFIDTFPEMEHKFGPWKPIVEYRKKHNLPDKF